jgi:5-methylcytosine-specific restriction protein A
VPLAPLRHCTAPECRELTRDGRCKQHERKAWTSQSAAPVVRLRGRHNQKARLRLFREKPLCAMCEASGRVTAATVRDHIVPLAEGGLESEDNVQGLCEPCHRAKTATEAARGKRRAL